MDHATGEFDEVPIPFGKHRGKPLREVPLSYLHWALDNADVLWSRPTLREAIRGYLGLGPEPSGPGHHAPHSPPPPPRGPDPADAARIRAEVESRVRAEEATKLRDWFRQASLKYHPDRRPGKSAEAQIIVNNEYDQLKKIFQV